MSISTTISKSMRRPSPSAYVPSNAVRPDGQRRMPRTEELPAVARRTLDATDRHEVEPRNARALFKRLASNVGLNLRQGQESAHDETAYSSHDDAAARSAIEAGGARVSRGCRLPRALRANSISTAVRLPARPKRSGSRSPRFFGNTVNGSSSAVENLNRCGFRAGLFLSMSALVGASGVWSE